MYYKITNKESDVYKKLHEMRSDEIRIEEENEKIIREKVGLKFDNFIGYLGQQTFCRVTEFISFEFIETEKVDLKIWKPVKKQDRTVYEPNRRYKVGREMSKSLSNGLQKSLYTKPLDILGIGHMYGVSFIFPYVEIFGETILIFLDPKMEPDNQDVIEITKKEFEEIQKENRE
jgi:hypothetical protein